MTFHTSLCIDLEADSPEDAAQFLMMILGGVHVPEKATVSVTELAPNATTFSYTASQARSGG